MGRPVGGTVRRELGIDAPEVVEWHGWQLGKAVLKTLVVRNVSTKNTVVKFKLPSSRHFQTDYPEPLKLVPGMTARVNVTFKANKDAEYHDELEFETPAGNFKVKLVATRPATRVEVPDAVDFGFVAAKETGQRTFFVKNQGETPLDFQWKTSAPFSIEPETFSLLPGSSQQITATLAPDDAATYVSSASLTYGDDGSFVVVSLKGAGKYPFLRVGQPVVDMGEGTVGSAQEGSFTLTNQSLVNANYQIARVDQEHDHVFTMLPTSGLLTPGASETVKVSFVPGTPGVFSSEQWRITTPGGVATTVTLRGLARAPTLLLSDRVTDFGAVKVGDAPQRTVSLQNTSDVPVRFQIDAEARGPFELSRTSGEVLPGRAVTWAVTFRPREAANYYKRVTVLLQDTAPLAFDLIATSYTEKQRPPTLERQHVDAARVRAAQAAGAAGSPEEIVEREWAGPVLFDRFCFREPACMLSVDEPAVDFGTCAFMRPVEPRPVRVTNRSAQRVVVTWPAAAAPAEDGGRPDGAGSARAVPELWSVYPAAAELGPGETGVFRVSFRPNKPGSYFGGALDVYAYPKVQRSWRLPTGATVEPSWSLTVRLTGNTFAGLDEYAPRAELSAHRVVFAACRPGEMSFRTVALENSSDVPLSWAVAAAAIPPDGAFAVQPRRGVTPARGFSLVTFGFCPAREGWHQERAPIELNGGAGGAPQMLALAGMSQAPKVHVESSTVFIRPTGVGATTTRVTSVTNAARVPSRFELCVPPKYGGVLRVSPASGVLRGRETVDVTWTFRPSAQRQYRIAVPLVLRSERGGGSGGADAAAGAAPAEEVERLSLEVVAEGTAGGVRLEPADVAFGSVAVGAEAQRTVSVVNDGDGVIEFVVDVVRVGGGPGGDADDAAAGPCALVASPQTGTVAARSRATLTLTLTAASRGPSGFRVVLRSGAALSPRRRAAAASKGAAGAAAALRVSRGWVVPALEDPTSSSSSNAAAAASDPDDEAPSASVTGEAAYPSLQVTGAWMYGVAKATLWEVLGLDALNRELDGSPSEAEQRMLGGSRTLTTAQTVAPLRGLPLVLGAQTHGSADSVLYLKLTNCGALPAEWRLRLKGEPEIRLESWVDDPEPPTEEDQRHDWIVRNHVFDVYPREGFVGPGESGFVAVLASHNFPGTFSLPAALTVSGGRTLRLDLEATTLELGERSLRWTEAARHLVPQPLGARPAPVQTVALRNGSLETVGFHVDTSPLDDLNERAFGFRVLRVLNPRGTIPPLGQALLHVQFEPAEAITYEAELKVRVLGGARAGTLRLVGRGVHPKAPEGEFALAPEEERDVERWRGFSPTAEAPPDNAAPARLSADAVLFRSVRPLSVTSRVLVLSSLPGAGPLAFSWRVDPDLPSGCVRVEPQQGHLPEDGSVVLKVVFAAGAEPAVLAAELQCDLSPAGAAPPHLPAPPRSLAPTLRPEQRDDPAYLASRGAPAPKPSRVLEQLTTPRPVSAVPGPASPPLLRPHSFGMPADGHQSNFGDGSAVTSLLRPEAAEALRAEDSAADGAVMPMWSATDVAAVVDGEGGEEEEVILEHGMHLGKADRRNQLGTRKRASVVVTSTMAQTRKLSGTVLHSRAEGRRAAATGQSLPPPPAAVLMGTREHAKEPVPDPVAGPLGEIAAGEMRVEVAPQVQLQMVGGWTLCVTVHAAVVPPPAPRCIAPRVSPAAAPAHVPSVLASAEPSAPAAAVAGAAGAILSELQRLVVGSAAGGALRSAVDSLPARAPVRPWLELTGKIPPPEPPADAFSGARALLRGPAGAAFAGLAEYVLEGTLFNIVKQALLEAPRPPLQPPAAAAAEAAQEAGAGEASPSGAGEQQQQRGEHEGGEAAGPAGSAAAAAKRGSAPGTPASTATRGGGSRQSARGPAPAGGLQKQPSSTGGGGGAAAPPRVPTPPLGAPGPKARHSKLVAAKG